MKKAITTVLFTMVYSTFFLSAQTKDVFERKGFVFGASVGPSLIWTDKNKLPAGPEFNLSLPNLKLGVMINNRLAVRVCLPGTIYKYKGAERTRDRGFEGVMPSVQFWLKERWWIMGGAGLGMDAPAFYDIKNEEERKFYFGGAFITGTGVDLWRKKRFAIDAQFRSHVGRLNIPEGTRRGIAFNLLIGFNWY